MLALPQTNLPVSICTSHRPVINLEPFAFVGGIDMEDELFVVYVSEQEHERLCLM